MTVTTTNSHSVVVTPKKVFKILGRYLKAHGKENCGEKQRHRDADDEVVSITTTSTELSTKDRLPSKNRVSFNNTVSELIVQSLKHDLSRKERGEIWYSCYEIDRFTNDYYKDLRLQSHEMNKMTKPAKYTKAAVRVYKKLFSRERT